MGATLRSDPVGQTEAVMLTARQQADWKRSGWLVAHDAFTDAQLTEIDAAAREVESWGDKRGLAHFEQTPYGAAIARSEDFEPHHGFLRSLLRSSIITDTVDALFGEPGVLFKEKINYKHPGAAGYAPHQDAPAYPFGSLHITMLLALDSADTSNGCLEFAKGAHHNGVIDVNADGCLPIERAAQLEWTPMPVAAGDAVFFNSFAPHRSGTNRSDRSRRALYVTYNASSEGDLRSEYYDHKKQALAEGRVSLINHFLGEDVS